MINFDQPDLSPGKFLFRFIENCIFFIQSDFLKIVKVFPGFGEKIEIMDEIRKVSSPSELTERQNKTIQVWDRNSGL